VKSPVVGSCLALTCLAGINYERYQAISMKLFFLLFLGWFGVESVVLFATANATHPLNPAGYFLTFPAIWIAMAVGGVHSAGFLSLVIGLATIALLYAVLTSVLVFLASRLRGRALRKRAMEQPPPTK
jgi:hypothetical protein